jgi:Tol biopolymer transport system component
MFTSEGLRVKTIATVGTAALVVAGALITLLLTRAEPTEAAFPGLNGKIVFTSDRTTGTGVNNPTGDFEIFTMSSTGANLTQLTFNTAFDTEPSWSADGKRIAFASNQNLGDNPGLDHEIYRMNADGSNQVNVTKNSTVEGSPAWSPSSKKIAFVRDNSGLDVFTINTDGTNQVRLTKSVGNDADPNWSPNGKKIAFRSNSPDNNFEIYVMKPFPEGKANHRRNLSRHSSASDFNPNWSPNGTQIAFDSDRGIGGDPEVYKMKSDGTDQSPLTENAVSDYDPAWSPFGDKIAFTSTRDGDSEIYVMNQDGSEPVNRTNNSASDTYPDWQAVFLQF